MKKIGLWEIILLIVKERKERVGNKKVILGLSGGVDSSVAAALINKAIGKQLTCIFVDTGLRKEEAKQVMEVYAKNFDMNIKCIDSGGKIFIKDCFGVSEPESKRKIIGKEFVEVFNEEAKKLQDLQISLLKELSILML